VIEVSSPSPHITVIRINRPERRNAFNLAGFRALAEAWRTVARANDVRAVVITGERDFSSGADLRDFPADVAEAVRRGEDPERVWGDVHHAVLRDVVLPVPVIAAIEGLCLGGGMELVGATDIRIAGASASFALPEVRHGYIPSGGSIARLPRQIGYAAAMQVMLTGARFGAEQMRAYGFVSEVVPDGTSLARALEIAEQIAQNAPAAVAAVKRAVGEGIRGTLADAYAVEARVADEVLADQRGDG
jgi:enoyl-CoA hydratase